MQIAEEISNVIEGLKEGLHRYKDSRPTLSWRAISKQSGVNRYFIKKIIESDNDSASKNVDYTQAMMLAQFLEQKESTKKLYQDTPSKAIRTLQQGFQKFVKAETPANPKVMETEDAVDFDSFCILVLAHSSAGVQQKEILQILGENGRLAIESLRQDEKISVSEEGTIRLADPDSYLTVSPAVRKMHIQNFISRFLSTHDLGRVSGSQEKRNHRFSHIHINRINSKAYAELEELHFDFYSKVADLMEKQENAGNIPVFSVGSMDSMLKNS